jgi:outer membrane lipoprotein-sorting protein
MYSKNLSLLLIFFVTCSLFAQNNANSATSILEKTAQKFNTLSTFSLDFTVKVVENEKTILSLTGTAFGKKEKYLISFDEQIIANDGKMMWTYQKLTNEALLFEGAEDEFLIFHPTKILNNWAQEYSAKFIKEEELRKKLVFVLDLTPKNKAPFTKIRLFIDKTTSYIQQVMMYETDGSIITYSITKFTPDAIVTDEKFIFNKKDYPDVEVIDMR